MLKNHELLEGGFAPWNPTGALPLDPVGARVAKMRFFLLRTKIISQFSYNLAKI